MESSCMKNEEFQEDDIWGHLKQRKDSDSDSRMLNSLKEPSIISKRLPTATRMMPKSSNRNSDSRNIQHSAPLNIPDWSKIYGTGDDEDEDEEGCVIPPHEWIARRQISSFSVCEGAGRTLKGRDLSRVRNAVLIKTGFLESKSNY